MTLSPDTLSVQTWMVLDAIAKAGHPVATAEIPDALPADFAGSLHAHEVEASLGSLLVRSLLREAPDGDTLRYEPTEAGTRALAEFWDTVRPGPDAPGPV